MTTPFPFVSGAVLTAQELNDIQNLPISDKTVDYVLVVGDVTKRTIMNAAGATTITVDDSIFTVGDVIQVANKGAGVCTITAGAGVTIDTSGSLALAQFGGGYLLCLSASTFTFFNLGGAGQTSITVDFLVLAAGGGGGGNGGGGGGGGVRSSVTNTGGGGSVESAQTVFTNNDYPVIVGAGGSGGATGAGSGSVATVRAVNGGVSQFNTIVSSGGGAGAGFHQFAAQDGGAGGGQAVTGSGANIGVGTTNQGFAGGTGGSTAAAQGYGGGGGGGGVGGNHSPAQGGAGGVGVASSITGSSVTYSGGGGGGCNTAGTGGTGGSSNGGNGSATSSGTNGTVNRGGGGGASGNAFSVTAGNGSSGIVILRYADTLTITIGTGLTGTESAASGGYKRATITAGTGQVRWS